MPPRVSSLSRLAWTHSWLSSSVSSLLLLLLWLLGTQHRIRVLRPSLAADPHTPRCPDPRACTAAGSLSQTEKAVMIMSHVTIVTSIMIWSLMFPLGTVTGLLMLSQHRLPQPPSLCPLWRLATPPARSRQHSGPRPRSSHRSS